MAGVLEVTAVQMHHRRSSLDLCHPVNAPLCGFKQELDAFDLDGTIFELGLEDGPTYDFIWGFYDGNDGMVPELGPASSDAFSDSVDTAISLAHSGSSGSLTSSETPILTSSPAAFPMIPGSSDLSPSSRSISPPLSVPTARAWPAVDLPPLGMTREERVARYREKRKRRTFEKTIRYESRKAYAEVRPRIKGRFATRKEVAAMKAAAAIGAPPPF